MRTLSGVITGQMPSGKNAINNTRSGHRYPNERFELWRFKASIELKQFMRAQNWVFPSETKLSISIEYTPGDLRRRDVPGIEDALCHLFERCGVVVDDANLVDWHFLTMPLDRLAPMLKFNLQEKEV